MGRSSQIGLLANYVETGATVSAGYSGTPLGRKLGIKNGMRVATLNPPATFPTLLEPLPPGCQLFMKPRRAVNVVIAFCRSVRSLRSAADRAIPLLDPDSGLWFAWPKQSSPLAGELNFSIVQAAGLRCGLVDNKICAIDDDWSGLRFVVPLKARKHWPGRG